MLVGTGDVNGDGRADIITGTGIGGGPRVQVFNGVTLATIYNFFAYESSFRGGVYAAVGDLNKDSVAEIVTGVGNGGGPVVKIFNAASLAANTPTPTPTKSFFAYDPSFRGGVRVDVADTNADGKLDILTGPGPGNRSDVKSFNFADLSQIFNVTAFDNFFGGVFVGGSH